MNNCAEDIHLTKVQGTIPLNIEPLTLSNARHNYSSIWRYANIGLDEVAKGPPVRGGKGTEYSYTCTGLISGRESARELQSRENHRDS